MMTRHLNPEQRRALELLASSPFGVTEALIFANGFTRRTLAGLIRAGLISRQKVINAGDKPIEVGKVRITYSGRRALE
jgi:hypothetical protein